MNKSEYAEYYLGFLLTTIGSSVKREANNDSGLKNNIAQQMTYENKKNALLILSLVSFIESNFITKADFKLLRQFKTPSVLPPISINCINLSCFIYLRDCFAHNPDGVLLGSGVNTTNFCNSISTGVFPFATISGQSITIDPKGIPELHLYILRFYGDNV